MARLRQLHPENYRSSPQINDDVRNIINYLNSAEHGNQTIAELLSILFDADGKFRSDARVELSYDASYGIQMKAPEQIEWVNLVPIEDIRGESGIDVGTLLDPIYAAPYSPEYDDGETVINFSNLNDDYLIIYKNGLLMSPDEYTVTPDGGAVGFIVFNDPLSLVDSLQISRLRSNSSSEYVIKNIVVISDQTVFGFEFSESDQLLIYRNGIYQQEGGISDYTLQPTGNTITFNTPVSTGSKVTVIKLTPTNPTVAGIMLEQNFVDSSTGNIKIEKVAIDDDSIPPVKITGLQNFLSNGMSLILSDTAPVTEMADEKTLWLDTSKTPAQLNFYDGSDFISTNPESELPAVSTGQPLQLVMIDSSGQKLVFGDLDLSAYMLKSQRGQTSGVASLDSAGRLPVTQLPESVGTGNISLDNYTTPDNTDHTKKIDRFYKRKVEIYAYHILSASGTGDIDIALSGNKILNTNVSISSVATSGVFSDPVQVNTLDQPVDIELQFSNLATLSGVEVTLAYREVVS